MNISNVEIVRKQRASLNILTSNKSEEDYRVCSNVCSSRKLDFSESKIFGRLRWEIFVEQLNWIDGDRKNRIELDKYDKYAIHFGVFKGSRLVGYLRLLKAGNPEGLLMENTFFQKLWPRGFSIPADSMEISRFCIEGGFRRDKENNRRYISLLLFKQVYNYIKIRNVQYLYGTADGTNEYGYNHKTFLTRLFPFKVIGGPVKFREDVETFLLELHFPSAEKNLSPFMKALFS